MKDIIYISSPTISRSRLNAYWITTGIVVAELIAGSGFDLLKTSSARLIIEHLGYPDYLMTILGFWKLMGAIALIVPGFPMVKEWAYAGIFFEMSGAGASHLLFGDGIPDIIAPLFFIILTIASWALRPPNRRL
jgi:hypothetical protein